MSAKREEVFQVFMKSNIAIVRGSSPRSSFSGDTVIYEENQFSNSDLVPHLPGVVVNKSNGIHVGNEISYKAPVTFNVDVLHWYRGSKPGIRKYFIYKNRN